LGPDRFKSMNNTAWQLLDFNGYIVAPKWQVGAVLKP
jgi:hypothetical protein